MNQKAYAIVTAAYWGFTLTDGALRMLVLLYFHGQGMDPVTLVTLLKNTGQAAAAEQQPAMGTTAAVGGMAQALAAGTLRPPMNGSII